MKRILFVMHSLDFGGAERSLVNLLSELPEDRYEVDVLLFRRSGGFLGQLPKWVHVWETPEVLAGLYQPITRSGRQCLMKITGTFCARLLRRGRKAQAAWRWKHVYGRSIEKLPQHYDTAVAFSGAEILYYITDKVEADRKIVFIHNDYRSARYSAEDDAPYMEKMDAVVSISKQCVEVLREVFPQIAERTHYLENITSSELIRRRAGEDIPVEYDGDENRILSIGRLWPQKGFDLAIDAAAMLRDQGIVFKWIVLGEGAMRQALQKQIAARGLNDCFVLAGARENPYPYMRACDLLVQSSRYEGKSVVLDEAKMLCKPIVATAYPTVSDQILDGKEGIVTALSAEGIAAGIRMLLSDEAKREALVAYLAAHEYGNQAEVVKYMELLDA